MTPRPVTDPRDRAALLPLVRDAFAEHDGRVDPPSSARELTAEALRDHPGEVWAIGDPPEAVILMTPRPDHLHVGKLAVRADRRGRGHARALIEAAARRAAALGLAAVVLQTRIELTGNHAAFEAMGFERAGLTAHPGFERPTSVTYRRAATPTARPGAATTDAGPVPSHTRTIREEVTR